MIELRGENPFFIRSILLLTNTTKASEDLQLLEAKFVNKYYSPPAGPRAAATQFC